MCLKVMIEMKTGSIVIEGCMGCLGCLGFKTFFVVKMCIEFEFLREMRVCVCLYGLNVKK